MKKYINISEASEILGVSIRTLQGWDKNGTLIPLKTAGKHRRYEYNEILNYYNNPNNSIKNTIDDKLIIGYCRVSSSVQLKDLDTQITNVSNYCYAKGYNFKIIKDLGSGLNYNKNGLNELINLILTDKISKIVINYKDRLIRYGFELIELLCKHHHVDIEIINNTEDKTFEQELVDDVLSLLTVFSARLYGSRSKKTKKILTDAKNNMKQK